MYRVDFFLNIMIFKWLSSKYDFPCLSTPPIDERSNGHTYASLISEKPISVKKNDQMLAQSTVLSTKPNSRVNVYCYRNSEKC